MYYASHGTKIIFNLLIINEKKSYSNQRDYFEHEKLPQ
ncbi:MAG: hypothetical protein RLZZ46_1141 [Bacteroidota bacterium]|jgi:hypothetical protein